MDYINNGSDRLRGTTWAYVPRSRFAGTEITWKNKREVIKEKAREYKEKNPEASTEECVEWGKRFVRREQKHFKAFMKGKNSYLYKGGQFLVEDQSRLEQFIKFAKELEEKYETSEEVVNNVEIIEN
jgi:hypothetical protein